MISWLIFAVVVVPLAIVGFALARRRTAEGEHPGGDGAPDRAEIEREFAAAEAYEEEWREEDKRTKRFYRLSPSGEQILEQLLAEWQRINDSLSRIL